MCGICNAASAAYDAAGFMAAVVEFKREVVDDACMEWVSLEYP